MNGKKARPEIWAIGGGKGGTGKSFLSCSLGIKLSRQNKNTVIIDGDLGGSNLHSFFGRDKINGSLTDFFFKKKELSDLVSDSGFKGLSFIAGDLESVNPSGIPYFSRAKFYRKIGELDYDTVIIDLGAGSVLNTIDTFLIADKKIVVSTPEITSIENLYLFIKKVLIRKISDLYLKHGYGRSVKKFWRERGPEVKVNTFSDFINFLKEADSSLSEEINSEYSTVNLNIVLNQITDDSQIKTGISLNSIIRNHFKINSQFSGYIEFDKSFRKIIDAPQPAAEILNNERLMNSVSVIAENIISGNSHGIKL